MKAVFFDVDGTLIDCVEKKIPASSIKAIEELKKNGIRLHWLQEEILTVYVV